MLKATPGVEEELDIGISPTNQVILSCPLARTGFLTCYPEVTDYRKNYCGGVCELLSVCLLCCCHGQRRVIVGDLTRQLDPLWQLKVDTRRSF